jgi:uncharacterized iron-regulated membrane protein
MHRYVGLVIALFLVIAGFTGIFLAFYNELDAAINHDIAYVQAPSVNAQSLDPFTLRDKVLVLYPQANIGSVDFKLEVNSSASYYLDAKTNPVTKAPFKLEYNQIYINPYTAEVLGGRNWGAISEGLTNLMPFVYQLHYSLALGTIGSYAFGIVALLWTVDCFVGAYLTFPARQKKQTNLPHRNPLPKGQGVKCRQTWLHRWWKSWKIRWQGGFYKVNFDLHRAGGLWLWAMLFVFAWSSVGFNLQEVYSPVTKALFEMQKNAESLPAPAKPLELPALNFRQAYAISQKLMENEAEAKNFTVMAPRSISYDAAKGYYQYRVKSSLDVGKKI